MARFLPAIAAALLAVAGSTAGLLAQDSLPENAVELRRWRQERPAPQWLERSTHRGHEVSRGPIVVIAATSIHDARMAAEHAASAWDEMAELAARFQAESQPPIPLGSLQIFLDQQSPPERLGIAAGGSPVGQMTQMAIAARPGMSLNAVQEELRLGAARAYLHAAALDRHLPGWICDGLAAYVAAPEVAANIDEQGTRTGRKLPLAASQQRLANSSDVLPGASVAEHSEAAELVRFLLEGDDARHAGPFLTLLAEQVDASGTQAGGQLRLGRQPAAPIQSPALDKMVTALAADFEHWKRDPQMGQPVLAAEESADDGLEHERDKLLIALKLLERVARRDPVAIRTRVTTFDRGRREAVVLTSTAATKPPSLRAMFEQLTQNTPERWAIVAPNGKLLWNTDAEQLQEILGLDENRYQHVWHHERWVLQMRLADGRRLLGWLQSNPQDARRPLARIELPSAE